MNKGKKIALTLVVLVLAGCSHRTTCRGTITGPHNEWHADSVEVRCK